MIREFVAEYGPLAPIENNLPDSNFDLLTLAGIARNVRNGVTTDYTYIPFVKEIRKEDYTCDTINGEKNCRPEG